jgi:hypothetical protein
MPAQAMSMTQLVVLIAQQLNPVGSENSTGAGPSCYPAMLPASWGEILPPHPLSHPLTHPMRAGDILW